MALWLAKEFDWDTGRYTGKYYDIAEAGIVAVFVDSKYGLDTNAGTAASPFKTLGKAITTLNSTGANGSRIFMNGIFSENLPSMSYSYHFIGCGGGQNGRVIFAANPGVTRIEIGDQSNRAHKIENIETFNYQNTIISKNESADSNAVVKWLNCFLKYCMWIGRGVGLPILYNCIAKEMQIEGTTPIGITPALVLQNSVLYNIKGSAAHSTGNIQINGENNYVKIADDNVAVFIDGQTSGYSQYNTGAQFISPDDNNFNVQLTSPLLFAGPVNELSGVPNSVGDVKYGLSYSGLRSEFNEAGGATITNLVMDSNGRYSLDDDSIPGNLITAKMNLGNVYPIKSIDVYSIFNFSGGEITEGVTKPFTSPRMALTYLMRYGLLSADIDDCPWLLMEVGKEPTVSGTGASRKGNADNDFDPDSFTTIEAEWLQLDMDIVKF